MEIKTEIFLRHSCWESADFLRDQLGIFARRVDVFLVAAAIGVADDMVVENEEISEESAKSIGRNTLQVNEDVNSLLSFLYQNAILNSKLINLSMSERKSIAFNHDNVESKYAPTKFLTGYANYGMLKLAECITDHDIETIQNIIKLVDYYREKIGIDEEELTDIELL